MYLFLKKVGIYVFSVWLTLVACFWTSNYMWNGDINRIKTYNRVPGNTNYSVVPRRQWNKPTTFKFRKYVEFKYKLF